MKNNERAASDPLLIDVVTEVRSRVNHEPETISFLDRKEWTVEDVQARLLASILRGDTTVRGAADTRDPADEYIARLIASDEEGRFIRLPTFDILDEVYWMGYFTEMVGSPAHERLRDAIDSTGTAARFQKALAAHPEEQELWSHFLLSKRKEDTAHWLEELGPFDP